MHADLVWGVGDSVWNFSRRFCGMASCTDRIIKLFLRPVHSDGASACFRLCVAYCMYSGVYGVAFSLPAVATMFCGPGRVLCVQHCGHLRHRKGSEFLSSQVSYPFV